MPVDFASQILAAHDYSEELEAAIGVTDLAIETGQPETAHEWLDFLGLLDVKITPWDEAAVARYLLAHHRIGRRFSANTLNEKLPQRARKHARKVVKKLLAADLIEPAHTCRHCKNDIGIQFEFSRRAGSKGWIVQTYQLSQTGEKLAAEIAPVMSQGELSIAGYISNGSISR